MKNCQISGMLSNARGPNAFEFTGTRRQPARRIFPRPMASSIAARASAMRAAGTNSMPTPNFSPSWIFCSAARA